MIITQTYKNGEIREYQVLSFENIENDSAIMMTSCSGAVAISAIDTPDMWEQFQKQQENK